MVTLKDWHKNQTAKKTTWVDIGKKKIAGWDKSNPILGALSQPPTPKHLYNFKRLYLELVDNGWFAKVDRIMRENPDKLPAVLTNYVLLLLNLIHKETDMQRKYDFYQALVKYLDYLGGTLGR